MPRTVTRPRTERIELRASAEEKALLARAAEAERTDVTSFVLGAALPAARRTVTRSQRLALSARDTDRLLNLLDDPPPLAAALVKAFRARHAR
jgi:uncharacterized protein (DUF1778 family)